MNRTTCMEHAKRLALGLAALALAATPSFAQTYDLCASDGTVTIDGVVVPIWGYADITGGGSCTAGLATLPGPELSATAGATLTINLSNALSVPVSVFIPGLAKAAGDPLAPQTAADAKGRQRLTSLDETVAAGASGSYTWTAREGTYLYESGTDVRTQVPMGLYGALVVTGTGYPAVGADEVLVFSEIDPALNANPGTFGGARVSTWNPKYFLINGKAYPDTAAIAINLSDDVLLRFVNAGLQTFVPTLGGGLYMDVIAEDGNLYPHPLTQYGIELPAAKTIDAVINAGAEGSYALYDRALHLANGGMVTTIQAAAAVGAPVAVADSYSVAEEGTLVALAGDLSFPGVLDNDTGGAAAACR
jgi:FtsP/CotA-like multicopper oxidase with cupredoxin domain